MALCSCGKDKDRQHIYEKALFLFGSERVKGYPRAEASTELCSGEGFREPSSTLTSEKMQIMAISVKVHL